MNAEQLKKSLLQYDLNAPLPNGWLLRSYQQDTIKTVFNNISDTKGSKPYIGTIVALDMGLGKSITNTTSVLTPSGWVKMGDIKVGDFVIGSCGTSTEVLGVYPQGKLPIYRVTFTDDTFTDCGKEHLWQVSTPVQKSEDKLSQVLSVEQLLENGLHNDSMGLKYYIPMVKAVQFTNQDLPLHPYVLGVLLGKGYLQNGITWYESNKEVVEAVTKFIPQDNIVTVRYGDGNVYPAYSIVKDGVFNNKSNTAMTIVKQLGLYECTKRTKFIPDIYKFSCTTDRLYLLQGILDSASSLSSNGVTLIYNASSKQLCLDVKFLVESFGGTARLTEYDTQSGGHYYKLNVCLPADISPFYCNQKKSLYKPKTKRKNGRGIKSIELLDCEEECTCIAVAAPDHLYVIEHCIVTHNTVCSLVVAKQVKKVLDAEIIVVCPATLKDNWKRESSEYVGVDINIYSWQKQPEPPEGKFFLIGDEVHAIQNLKSGRSKAFLALAQHPNCVGCLPLSGTPMKNGQPQNLFPLLKAVRHPLAKSQRSYESRYCNAHPTPFTAWDTTGSSNLKELHEKISDMVIYKKKEDCEDLPPKIRVFKTVVFSTAAQKVYNDTFKQIRQDYLDRAERGEISMLADSMVILSQLRRANSIAKVEFTVDAAKESIEQGNSVVIFTEFVDSAKLIHSQLGGELLTGESPVRLRQAMVDRYQAGESTVFTATTEAGGVGITLTKGTVVILSDRSWVPGMAMQCEDRCYRISQKNTVLVIWPQAGVIDTIVDNSLINKSEQIEMVLTGQVDRIKGRKITDMTIDILNEVFGIKPKAKSRPKSKVKTVVQTKQEVCT